MAERLRNFVGGAWVESSGHDAVDVHNPATGQVLARTPLSTGRDVDNAVARAREAFGSWRATPPTVRARALFRFRALLDAHRDEIARICTNEHGKTLAEAQSDIGRGIENVEHACGIPTLMMSQSLEDVAAGIDCVSYRQPMGVFAAITPFNFPPMVPLWFFPYAVAMGNTFVLKPSERVPLSQQRIFELAAQAGFPDGVLNLVHGGREVVEALCQHPDIQGVSFVGSTAVARRVYELATSLGKRVQALGGAKNFLVVMPDAVLDPAVQNACESAFGCGGQRCLAGSTIIAVGDSIEPVREAVVRHARALRVGDGLLSTTTMGPVISMAARERILQMIQRGVEEGATLLVDGREHVPAPEHAGGFWLGPTVFDGVQAGMTIAREEIFGPVLNILHVRSLDDAIVCINGSRYANAASIYTSSGKHVARFKAQVHPTMLGVNVGVAAPMAFFPFGGAKESFFGDVKAHGPDAVQFYTDRKVVISRWF